MKFVLLILVVSLALVSTDAFLPEDVELTHELARRSALGDIKNFLKNAMNVGGKGCSAIAKYVTGPVCKAIKWVPKGTEAALCGFALEFYGICLGTIEGARTYCGTLGHGTLPGGPKLDAAICKAIQKHG